MALFSHEIPGTNCSVYGKDTVPWCPVNSPDLSMVPNHVISPERGEGIRIPLVMVNTGTKQKYDSFVLAATRIRQADPNFKIDRIVWANDVLPGGEESAYVHGTLVSEEKADRWWSKYWKQKLQYVKEDGAFSCLSKNKCWRFPRVVFTDIRVSWNGSGSNEPREYLENLKDELMAGIGEEKANVAYESEAWLKGYIIYRATEKFDKDEQAVIHLDPGTTALRFEVNPKTNTIGEDDFMMASGSMNLTYSLPARIFHSMDFWTEYFQRISETYGSYKALLLTPMGLRFEHVLAVAKKHSLLNEGHDLIASVPNEGKIFNLSPEESLEMVAKGFHPTLVRSVLSLLETEQFVPASRHFINVGVETRQRSHKTFASLIYT